MAPSFVFTEVAVSTTDIKHQISSWLLRAREAISNFFSSIGEAVSGFLTRSLDQFVNALDHASQYVSGVFSVVGSWLLWIFQWILIIMAALTLLGILMIAFRLSIRCLANRHIIHRARGPWSLPLFTTSAPRYRYHTFQPARAPEEPRRRHDGAARTPFSTLFTGPRGRSTPMPPDETAQAAPHRHHQSRYESARAAAALHAARAEREARERLEEAARAAQRQRRLREEEVERRRRLDMDKKLGEWSVQLARTTGDQVEQLACIPRPPGASLLCRDASCRALESTRRAWGFCKHSLADMKDAYERLHGKDEAAELLREVITKWHPNRSIIVLSKKLVKEQAAELTAILNGLLS